MGETPVSVAGSDENQFRPSLPWRMFYVVFGVAIVLPFVLFLDEADSSWQGTVARGLLLVIWIYTAIRAQFAGVSLGSDSLRIRGLFYSRTIPRTLVLGVGPDVQHPWIVWKSKRRRRAIALVEALYSDNWNLLRNEDRSRSFLARIEQWEGG